MVKTDGFVAGDDDDEEDAGDDKVKVELVLKEFRGRWQALLAGQVRVCLRENKVAEICASVFGTQITNID